MKTKPCPSCGSPIEIYDDLDVGYFVYCEECDSEFVLAEIDPVVLEPSESYDEMDDFYLDEDEY